MDLSGRTIVITGASRGLGRELALRLCSYESRLILVARDHVALAEVEAEIAARSSERPYSFVCDVSCERQVEVLADQVRSTCESVDVLVNNAGLGVFKPVEAISTGELRRQMEVNFYGAVHCTRAFMPLLTRSRSGYILNVGSLLSEVPLPATGAYAASKCALLGYTAALQRELEGSSLRTGIVLPGPMRTGFHTPSSEAAPTCPEFMRLRPERVAALMERMIRGRARRAYAFRSTLWLMRLKAACSRIGAKRSTLTSC